MYHDTGYSTSLDKVQVQVSTGTWASVGTPIPYAAVITQWFDRQRGLALGTIGQDYFDIELFPYPGSFPLQDIHGAVHMWVGGTMGDIAVATTTK